MPFPPKYKLFCMNVLKKGLVIEQQLLLFIKRCFIYTF